jgi:hypothetical protein
MTTSEYTALPIMQLPSSDSLDLNCSSNQPAETLVEVGALLSLFSACSLSELRPVTLDELIEACL